MPQFSAPGLALAWATSPATLRAGTEGWTTRRHALKGSISEMAAAERIERGYLGTLVRLTLLAPDIVEFILDGRQPP
jgi:hypothetical protein